MERCCWTPSLGGNAAIPALFDGSNRRWIGRVERLNARVRASCRFPARGKGDERKALDDHIPSLLGKADEGLVHYWRKEVSARIREMEGWAGRLSKHDDILAEATEYRRRLAEILNQRLLELAD